MRRQTVAPSQMTMPARDTAGRIDGLETVRGRMALTFASLALMAERAVSDLHALLHGFVTRLVLLLTVGTRQRDAVPGIDVDGGFLDSRAIAIVLAVSLGAGSTQQEHCHDCQFHGEALRMVTVRSPTRTVPGSFIWNQSMAASSPVTCTRTG